MGLTHQGFFPRGVKQVGHGAVHLLQTSAIVMNEESCISLHRYVPSWCRLGRPYFVSYLCGTCYTLCTITVMRHLTTGICSEKRIVRRFRFFANILIQT